jgi:hypothetical protein
MAGAFPGAVTNYTNPTSATYHDVPVGGRTQSGFLSDHSDDIEALATKLGISLAAPADTPVADRLLGSNASGKSGWMQLLAGMVPTGLITAAMIAEGAVPKVLARSVLGGTAASFSFTSIPATYHSLRFQFLLRTNAGSSCFLGIRFNNDSGATQYAYETLFGNGSAAQAFQSTGDSLVYTSELMRTADAANAFSGGIIDIYDYAATDKNKMMFSLNGWPTVGVYGVAAGWKSNAAINRVDFIPSVGSFIAGSSVTLWGMPT